MSSLLTLVLTLHVGTLGAPLGPDLRVAREARLVAAAVAFRTSPSMNLGIVGTRGGTLPASRADLAGLSGALPPWTTVSTPVRPSEEWIAIVARRLDMADSGLTHAALWLASMPVQLDVRPGFFYMRVMVRTR